MVDSAKGNKTPLDLSRIDESKEILDSSSHKVSLNDRCYRFNVLNIFN